MATLKGRGAKIETNMNINGIIRARGRTVFNYVKIWRMHFTRCHSLLTPEMFLLEVALGKYYRTDPEDAFLSVFGCRTGLSI